ncbi:MAG: hypothetical protein IPH24_06305 [Crocinitomicaceae bacterium]|jgi:hypothetical protein|nr:hypothetical protein [Crocinitomicaceae bacterium]
MVKRNALLISFLFLLAACSSDPLLVDVSDVEVNIAFERFDQKMAAAKSPEEMSRINEELLATGDELYEYYVSDMLRAGNVHDDSIGVYLYYFVTDTIMRAVFDDIDLKFGDFTIWQDEITNAFKHFKYHLPEEKLPEKVITYNSAFNYGVVSTEKYIGVGLEMYLGADNRTIQRIGFPMFMKEKMNQDYLLVDICHSWLISNVVGEDRGETFLSSMIYYGKLRYAVDAMLPEMEDSYKIRYTPEEYEWALISEYNIWSFLVDMNYIYSTEAKVKLRYFEEAPTTVDMEGSPGRIGQFIGWQIVKQYMEKNPDVTVAELLKETNESKILKAYKPQENE